MKSTVSYLLSSSSYHFHLIWPCALIVLESEEDEAFLSLIVSSYCYCAKMKNHPNGMPLACVRACVGGWREEEQERERERRWRCWGGGGGDGGSSLKRVKSSFCSLFSFFFFFFGDWWRWIGREQTRATREGKKRDASPFSLSRSLSLLQRRARIDRSRKTRDTSTVNGGREWERECAFVRWC